MAVYPVTDYVTCSRLSTGYGRDSSGTWQSYANNTLRYDYNDGVRRLLVEEGRTNRILASAGPQIVSYVAVSSVVGTFTDGETLNFAGGGSGKYVAVYSSSTLFAISESTGANLTGGITGASSGATATAGTVTACWGSSTTSQLTNTTHTSQAGVIDYMGLMTENATNNEHYRRQTITGITAGATITVSVHVKANGRTKGNIRILDAASVTHGIGVNFDLSAVSSSSVISGNGTIASTSITATDISGVYLVTITGVPNPGTPTVTAPYTSVILDLFLRDTATGNTIYLGDGVSGMYWSDIQLEEGSFKTSPIRTTSVAGTRQPDVVSMTLPTNLQSLNAYTLYAKAMPYSPTTNTANQIIASVSDGTTSNRVQVARTVAGAYFPLIVASGIDQMNTSSGTWAQDTTGKIAAAWTAGDQVAYRSVGTQIGVAANSNAMPGVNKLSLARADGAVPFNGGIEQVAVWGSRRTNSALATLTT